MTLELVIKDELLKSKIGVSNVEFSAVLNLQQRALEVKYSSDESVDLDSAKTLVKNASLMFAGAYHSLKETFAEQETFFSSTSPSFQRSYLTTLASEAVLQYVDSSYSDNVSPHSSTVHTPDIRSDSVLITASLKDVITTLKQTVDVTDTKSAVLAYFSSFKQLSKDKLHSFQEKNSLQKANKTTIKGKYFTLRGVEDTIIKSITEPINSANKSKTSSLFTVKPNIITIDELLSAKDILGNEKAKNEIKSSVNNAFAYNFSVNKNPFLEDGGFRQKYLLVGDSGSGKTILVHFAISEALRLSEKHGKEFEAIDLDFTDAHQDGPIKILKHQLDYVSRGDKIYLIAVDEADGKFPSREKLFNAAHKTETGNEMLNFLNGLSYTNKGNYIILFTSNTPHDLDKALRSRLKTGTHYCEGPVTPKQKGKVLENNLRSYLQPKFLKANKWDYFGSLCHDLNLQGRDLRSVAELIASSSRTNHFPGNFMDLSYDVQVREIKKRHTLVTNQVVEKAIYIIGNKTEDIQKAALAFSGGN